MTTTTTETTVTCPPSAVHDMIVEWGDREHVAAGDLVVHEGQWAIVARIDPYDEFTPDCFAVMLEGGSRFRAWGDSLVAVRRYDAEG